MGGFFGVVSKSDCIPDLFFGTDYHSHLGTKRGGLAVKNNQEFIRYIHDISNTPFRSKFEDDIGKMNDPELFIENQRSMEKFFSFRKEFDPF